MNVLGEGFHKNIIGQIDQRQKVYGSGYTDTQRSPEEIVYLNANTAWCKLMSSTNIKDIKVLNNPTITDLGLTGNELSKRFVLFNGTSLYDKGISQRGGITDTGNSLGINADGTSAAYGIGGTEFGINPMPGIQSISVSHENRGSLRQASVKLKAWNRAQFEIIDVLYLRLGFSVLLEWGNSMYFDNNGNLITNPVTNTLDSIFLEGESDYNNMLTKINAKRLETFGNYDAMFAKVKNFHWSFQKDGSYDITIDLISSGDIIESLKANAIIEDSTSTDSTAKTNSDQEKPENDNQLIDFYAKKSSIGQFFYFLKYQLDTGEYSEKGTKNRVMFSFSNLPNEAVENQNADIKLRNTLNDIEVYATLGLAKLAGIAWNWAFDTDFFVNKPPLPTNISPEMFKVYDGQGKEIKVVDAIQIPWDDKDGNDETYYVRFGTLLAYFQHYLIPKCISSKGNVSTSTPLLNIDYDQNTNLMYAHKWLVGVDPRICTVGRTIKIKAGLIWETWGDYDFSIDCSPFINPDFTNSTGEKDENGFNLITEYGNIMNIYVNMTYILNKIDELKDDKNKVSVFDILKGICDGINEGLGGINALEPVIDESSNILKIIDANPLPNKDEVLNKINALYKDLNLDISTELASFDLYGYTLDKNGAGKSSFIRDFNFTTEITPEYSTMITVGASANGSVVGANSTALSKLNIGLEDRYKTEILDAYEIKKKAADIKALAATASSELTALKERYNNTIDEYFDFLEELSDKVSEPTLNVEDVDAYKTTLSNIVQVEEQIRTQKYVADSYSKGIDPNDPKNQTLSPGTGFIPFNLSVTMDGLSGMKIYSKFTIDTRYLPSNYPKTVEFLIKNINHEVQDNKWTTKLESFCISKGKFADSSPQSTETGGGNNNDNTNKNNTTINDKPNNTTTSCGTPFSTQVPLSFNNKTNQKYINAFNKAIYNTFRGGKGESGMCSKYTYSTAASLINVLKGQAPGPQFLSGRGNAKDASVRNFLTSIGYNVVKAGENLNKSAVQNLLNSTSYNIGDIVIYWANDGKSSDNQVRYGHIQIYSGKVWNPYPYKSTQNNFVSSVPDNYTSNPFVYGRKPNQCWTAYVCRIPNI